MGDIANAPHGYEIFITDETLAAEWPLSRAACTRARGQLLDDGYLVTLSTTTAPGRARRYRFVFLGAEHMAINTRQGDAGSIRNTPQGDARTRRRVTRERASNAKQDNLSTEIEPQREPLAASLPGIAPAGKTPECSVTETDPVKRAAHKLTVFAFEQKPAPVTRGGFPAVMARIEAELRAGTSDADIKAAIVAGDLTWTADGLRNAINRARPQPRRRMGGDGDPRSLPQLLADAAEAERSRA
jgi:hypothetical protein